MFLSLTDRPTGEEEEIKKTQGGRNRDRFFENACTATTSGIFPFFLFLDLLFWGFIFLLRKAALTPPPPPPSSFRQRRWMERERERAVFLDER